MAYKSSPRPVFDGPAPIPYSRVTRHVWGDAAAGLVDDWIYVSSDKIHQLVFGVPPGDGFRHSESFRTVLAADEVLTVLMGTMVICNPETGETHLVHKGESVFFQKDTWHHAFAWGAEELRVLRRGVRGSMRRRGLMWPRADMSGPSSSAIGLPGRRKRGRAPRSRCCARPIRSGRWIPAIRVC